MARDGKHESFFSYNVSRKYELCWFTPLAVVGGLIFLVVFSFSNFAATGYELTAVYLTDPDNVDQHFWFRRFPTWLTQDFNGTCQPASLPVSSQFFTNQTALSYTLSSIAILENGKSSTSPSLPYMNNPMNQCHIISIGMDFSCSPYQNPTQLSSGACTIDVRADVTCNIHGPNGFTTFNCSALYNPYQSHFNPGSSSFIATNATSKASLWWAQQLLTTYWYDTNVALFEVLNPYGTGNTTYNEDKGIVSGTANFYRHGAQEDITKLDFFDLFFEFTGVAGSAFYYVNRTHVSVQAVIEQPDSDYTYGPPIWKQADRLAKSMYSAVMTDLGQTTLPRSSNIVANPDALQTFTQQFPSLHNQVHITGVPDLFPQVPNGAFNDLRTDVGSGPLNITPSVISTNYLCQVPRRKSIGNLVFSILQADLVFLQTTFAIYCFVVGALVLRSPTANYCDGCLSTQDLQPLRPMSESNATSMQKLPSLDRITTSSTRYEPLHMERADSTENLMRRA